MGYLIQEIQVKSGAKAGVLVLTKKGIEKVKIVYSPQGAVYFYTLPDYRLFAIAKTADKVSSTLNSFNITIGNI